MMLTIKNRMKMTTILFCVFLITTSFTVMANANNQMNSTQENETMQKLTDVSENFEKKIINDDKEDEPFYVPGEILVKCISVDVSLTEKTATTIKQLVDEKSSFSSITSIQSLFSAET